MIAFPVAEDSLGLVATEGRDLLRRVDLVIEHLGTPAGHALLPLLERLRLRPGEALRALLATSPGDLLAATAELRRLAVAYRDELVAPLSRSVTELGWGGAGFDAFARRWAVQARHVTADDGTSMAAKLELTADFAESAAGWFSQVRQAVATTLAEAFGSTEAVTLKACDLLDGDAAGLRRAVVTAEVDHGDRLVGAAATLGAATLGTVSRWYDVAVETFVVGDWVGRMAPLEEPHVTSPGDAAADPGAGWVRL